jgi:hypothetical protein
MAIAMVVLAAAFGITAAIAIFLRPAAPAPAPVVIQMSASPNATAPPTTHATTTGETDPASPPPTGSATTKGPLAMAPTTKGTTTAPTASATTTGTGGQKLDLGGLKGLSGVPTENTAGGNNAAAGQCLSEGQVRSVIASREYAIRKVCWLNSPSTRPSANISVFVSIGPNGNVESVSATGDDPVVAKCVESNVRSWSFPAGGCTQKTGFSFKFLRQ